MYVEIGEVPIWRGIQDKPGFEKKKFELYVNNGLIRLNLPDNEIYKISHIYGDENYTFITSPPGSSNWGERLGNFYFNILSEWVGDISGKTVLEIGSGTLYIARRIINELKAGHFIACDPVLDAREVPDRIIIAKNYFSFDLFEKYEKNLDLIISINNIEHIPDIKRYLNDVHQLLNPDSGQFFIVAPDCSRGFVKGDIGICVHEHLTYFTPNSLSLLLQSTGFRVERIVSIEDTLFVLAKPENKESSVFADDAQLKEVIGQYGLKVKSNLIYFETLLSNSKKKGSIALHGCGVGLNNTLGLLGISEDPDIFLFDGDMVKNGKYLPAFNKPIYSIDNMTYRQMKTVIIAALTYYDEIKHDIESLHNIHPDLIYPIIPFT